MGPEGGKSASIHATLTKCPILLHALHTSFLILTRLLWAQCYHFYFADEETGAQRAQVTHPKPHSQLTAVLGDEPALTTSKPFSSTALLPSGDKCSRGSEEGETGTLPLNAWGLEKQRV